MFTCFELEPVIYRTQSLVESLAEVEVEENVASMPVDRNSDRYNMKHSTRGKAVIFNHMVNIIFKSYSSLK